MIAKIICFIFGHLRTRRVNQRYTQDVPYRITEHYDLINNDICPRCGVSLEKEMETK